MHGVLAAYSGWLVTERSDNTLTAVLDFSGAPQLLAVFPFPHLLIQSATLADRTLTIATTVRPTTSAPVPMCFGYHPYLTLPGVPREDWVLTTPAMRHLPVDDNGIPTGEQSQWEASTNQLGSTVYDDGFDRVPEGAVFTLAGGGRRIDVTYEKGYPAAQLFAPANDAVIGIEPMTAPTDSLRRGGFRYAMPGTPETARFSIRVS